MEPALALRGGDLVSNEAEKQADALVKALLEHEDAEILQDYLGRGRRFERTETTALKVIWVNETRLFFRSVGERNPRDMNDAQAELGLRQIAVPIEAVQADLDSVRVNADDPKVQAIIRSGLRKSLARKGDYH
jgi:hypothetical protein